MNARKSTIINQQFKKFFIPTALMSMAVNMSIVIDSIIVGNLLGAEALAAINLVNPFIYVFSALYMLLGMGGANLYSIALGEGDKQKTREFFTVALVSVTVISVMIAVFGFLLSPAMAKVFAKDLPSLTLLVTEYMRMVMLSAPFFILVSVLMFFARAESQVKLSAVVMIVSNCVKLVMDVVYINIFNTGIQGAGMATMTGYFVGFLIALYHIRKVENLRLGKIPRDFFRIFSRIVQMGISNTLQGIMTCLSLMCLNNLVLSHLGGSGVTAFSICNSIPLVIAMFTFGTAQTMAPFLGTLYGERDYIGMRFTIKNVLIIAISAPLMLLLIVELIPVQIVSIFGITNPSEIASTVTAIRIYTIYLPFMSFLFITMNIYQILLHKKLATLIAVLENFSIVLVALVLVKVTDAENIWWSFLIGDFFTLVVAFMFVKQIQRNNPRKEGFFLLEKGDQYQRLELTMIQQQEQAVDLSIAAIEFCQKNKVSASMANRVGVVLEEMTINTISQKTDKNKSYIDVCLVISDKEIRIVFKDNGSPFNPLKQRDDETPFSNIQVALAMATEISYDYILGMNRSIVKIDLN